MKLRRATTPVGSAWGGGGLTFDLNTSHTTAHLIQVDRGAAFERAVRVEMVIARVLGVAGSQPRLAEMLTMSPM